MRREERLDSSPFHGARYSHVLERAMSLAMAGSSTADRVKAYSDRHPEQVFIGKAFLTVLAVLALRDTILGWLPPLPLLMFLSPLAFLIYVRLKAAAEDEHPDRMLARLVTLTPVMYAEGESRFRGGRRALDGRLGGQP